MDRFTKLTEMLDGFLQLGVPFYDCMVMKDGTCVYRHANGYTDPGKTVRVTGKERYHLYSCTKLITCTAALQLYECGAFRLDDPLYLYLPEFTHMTVRGNGGVVPAKNPITIRHLFTMTAGLSYDLHSPMLERCRIETNGECPTRETMKYLAQEPLLFEPGERWEYSLCHDVLAALVEVLAGQPFGQYVKEHIFDVCGMGRSTFGAACDLTPQYDCQGGVIREQNGNAYRLGTRYESGGAGSISTVEDYIAFLEGIRTYRLLRKETVDLLSTNQLTREQMEMPGYWVFRKRGYGLGQECPWEGDSMPGFGWDGAAGARYFVDCKNGITAYLGTHILHLGTYQQARCRLQEVIQGILV